MGGIVGGMIVHKHESCMLLNGTLPMMLDCADTGSHRAKQPPPQVPQELCPMCSPAGGNS